MRNDDDKFTTRDKALKYVKKIFPEFYGPSQLIDDPAVDSIFERTPFIDQFIILVKTAKELSQEEIKNQLPTDGEINEELKTLAKATDKYINEIKKLRSDTKHFIEREYINNGSHFGAETIFMAEHILRYKPSKKSKPNEIVQTGHVIEVLQEVKKYCESGKSGWGTKDFSDFTKVEWMLAQEYQKSGRIITEYEDGEFANVLKAFHLCCDIDVYRNKTVDNKYVARIKKHANKPWREQWRITPKEKT